MRLHGGLTVVLSGAGPMACKCKHQRKTGIRSGTVVGLPIHVHGILAHMGNFHLRRRISLRTSRSISVSITSRLSALASSSSADRLSKAALRRSFIKICNDSPLEIIARLVMAARALPNVDYKAPVRISAAGNVLDEFFVTCSSPTPFFETLRPLVRVLQAGK